MAKKRGLAANRGLDALLGSIKKEKQITASALQDDMAARDMAVPAETLESNALADATSANATASKTAKKPMEKPTDSDTVSDNKTLTPRTVSKSAAGRARGNHAEVGTQEDQISLVQIDVTRLQAGKYQPRRDMSETALAELASSIEQHGVMQPHHRHDSLFDVYCFLSLRFCFGIGRYESVGSVAFWLVAISERLAVAAQPLDRQAGAEPLACGDP